MVWFLRRFRPADPDPQGPEGVVRRGHREYVGGLWDEIGALQLAFLQRQGLKPEHYLIDIACGALRLGVKAIPYLERGHYLGIEKESQLLEAGAALELGPELLEAKQPQLLCDRHFRFRRFHQQAEMAMAQSLFTHLPPRLIERCLRKLRPCLTRDGVCFATFFEVKQPHANPAQPHDHGYFAYTRDQMLGFGERQGYQAQYIGDWDHPRGQVMVAYRPKQR